jgi:trigger factor
LRANDATLEDISRPAKDGDVLTIDLGMTPSGTEGEPTSLTDVSYTVGSQEFGVAELDVQLQGARVGDILKFSTEVSEGREMAFTVLVKAVREKRLPELTDEWVADQTEFATAGELQDDLEKRITQFKQMRGVMQLRDKALEALVELVTDDAPAPLVEAELERRLHDLGHRLEAQNATIEQYLGATGQEPEALVEELRTASIPSVKADLALRALADAEAIEASEDDVDAEIARMAEQAGRSAAQVRRNLVTSDQLPAVRSDIRKAKAVSWLMDHVEVVDPEGQPVDRALLEPATAPAETDPGDEEETTVMDQEASEQQTSDQEA